MSHDPFSEKRISLAIPPELNPGISKNTVERRARSLDMGLYHREALATDSGYPAVGAKNASHWDWLRRPVGLVTAAPQDDNLNALLAEGKEGTGSDLVRMTALSSSPTRVADAKLRLFMASRASGKTYSDVVGLELEIDFTTELLRYLDIIYLSGYLRAGPPDVYTKSILRSNPAEAKRILG